MTKKNIVSIANCDIDCGTLSALKMEIENLIEMYGEDATLVLDSGYTNLSQYVEYKRIESDSEYNKRLKAESKTRELEEKRSKIIEDKDRKEFERLKKKFEGKNAK